VVSAEHILIGRKGWRFLIGPGGALLPSLCFVSVAMGAGRAEAEFPSEFWKFFHLHGKLPYCPGGLQPVNHTGRRAHFLLRGGACVWGRSLTARQLWRESRRE